MWKRFFLSALILVAISIVCYAAFRLNKPDVRLKNNQIIVNLSAGKTVPYRVLSALGDGIKVRYFYDIRVRRRISFFLARDPVLTQKSIYYTVKLNFIEGSYSLKNSLTRKERIYNSRVALLCSLSRCDNIPVISFLKLKKDRKYYVEARARIRSIKMYPPFSFLSILSYDTDWVRSRYIIK